MFALLVLVAGADPEFVVVNRTTPTFVVVNKTTPPPAPSPAVLPDPIPAGYGRFLDGPNAGRLFPLTVPTPAAPPGCFVDPRTGLQVCPLPQRR